MKSHTVAFVAVVGTAALALAGAVGAQVVVQPSPPASQVVQAGDIEAKEVRAQTIYANKIKAPMVQGTVHQSDDVKIKDTKGHIKAPSVSAGVIYADTIKARSIVAEHIYVKDIQRD